MKDNTIVAHVEGYAVLLMDNGNLGYEQIDREFINIGEILLDYKYKPISELPESVQNTIIKSLGR